MLPDPDLPMVTLTAADLRRRLDYPRVVRVLAEGFRAADMDDSTPRSSVALENGHLLLMPISSRDGVGVKLLTAHADAGSPWPHLQGVFVLFAAETLSPVALLDGAALTAIRTAGVSALATDLLARSVPSRLLIFGTGVQAHSHLEAMCAVRQIIQVDVVAPSGPSDSLAALAEELGVPLAAAGPEAAAAADIICTCTTSLAPVFDGSLLRPGAHVNAIGTYTPQARELDGICIRESRVFVEHRASALAQAGDVALAVEEGHLRAADVVELGELLNGEVEPEGEGRASVFKSIGLAFEDLVVAQEALRAG